MAAKTKRIPALAESILTERFELKPANQLEAWRLRRKVVSDKEVRALLELRTEDPGPWRTWRRLRRPNGRTRFYHAIVDRGSGGEIGLHSTYMVPYRSATWDVAVFDRRWWGKGVVPEIRKALITALVEHAGVTQVTANVHVRNHASILNYHKLGFEHTGTQYSARHDELRDAPADFVMFSLRGEKLLQQVELWRDDTA